MQNIYSDNENTKQADAVAVAEMGYPKMKAKL